MRSYVLIDDTASEIDLYIKIKCFCLIREHCFLSLALSFSPVYSLLSQIGEPKTYNNLPEKNFYFAFFKNQSLAKIYFSLSVMVLQEDYFFKS